MVMEVFLFKNTKDPNLFRLLRLGKEWYETFVLEYSRGSDNYNHLYWGNKEYVQEDRAVISMMLVLTSLHDPKDEWIKVNSRQIGYDVNLLLSKAERDIQTLMDQII